MTALAGIWHFDGRPDAAEACGRMLAAQEIYGPHAGAQWSGGDIALGRRLMRTLPEDRFDRQPLTGGGGRYVLVADIRLDNRDELVDELRIAPESARASSDSAILLAAIERWGDTCFDHLIGEYAFVLWDGAKRRLLLARDPSGHRPLAYHRGGRFFAAASMAKGLHALAEIPYAPDEESVANILSYVYHLEPRTYFKGVDRVLPGHHVSITADRVESQRFWELKRRRLVLRSPDDYAEALREKLDIAVRCRLRGTGDVGTHLSAGLDCSSIAATAARLLAPTSRRVIAFTGVPRRGYDGLARPGRFADEGPGAAEVAALYPNMEHILVHNGKHSPFDYLDRSFFLFERPHISLSNLSWPISLLNAARDRNLTIMLSGGRGNTVSSFDGTDLFPELLRTGRWLHLFREARAFVKRSGVSYRTPLAWAFGPSCPPAIWSWLRRQRGHEVWDPVRYAPIRPSFAEEIDVEGRARRQGQDRTGRPRRDGFQVRQNILYRADPGNFLKGTLAGWHVDERAPITDLRLIEFCLSVPTDQYFRDGVPRALARRAFSDRLPKSIVEAKDRGLQSADWHEQRTADRERIADELDRIEACPTANKMIDIGRLRKLVANWPTEGWDRRGVRHPYNHELSRGIMAGYFLRRVAGSNQ